MMTTKILERTIKDAVRKRLKEIEAYYFFPVPMGLGETTLDILVCVKGRFVAIECKRPGGKPTQLQLITIERIIKAGGLVYVVDNLEAVDRMVTELRKL